MRKKNVTQVNKQNTSGCMIDGKYASNILVTHQTDFYDQLSQKGLLLPVKEFCSQEFLFGILSGYFFCPLASHLNKLDYSRMTTIHQELSNKAASQKVSLDQLLGENIQKILIQLHWLGGWTMFRLPDVRWLFIVYSLLEKEPTQFSNSRVAYDQMKFNFKLGITQDSNILQKITNNQQLQDCQMIMGFYLPSRYSKANNLKQLMSYLQGNVFFMTKEMPLYKCKHDTLSIHTDVDTLFQKFDEICNKINVNHGLTPNQMPDAEWLLNAIWIIKFQSGAEQRFANKDVTYSRPQGGKSMEEVLKLGVGVYRPQTLTTTKDNSVKASTQNKTGKAEVSKPVDSKKASGKQSISKVNVDDDMTSGDAINGNDGLSDKMNNNVMKNHAADMVTEGLQGLKHKEEMGKTNPDLKRKRIQIQEQVCVLMNKLKELDD